MSHQKDRSLDLIDSSATERIDTNEESIDKDEFEIDRDDVYILKNLSSSLWTTENIVKKGMYTLCIYKKIVEITTLNYQEYSSHLY